MPASADLALRPADAALVARDPALPALPLLLDDGALGALLRGAVRRRYLRYKPGTSCVLAARLAGRDVAVTAWSAQALPKLDKTLATVAPEHVLLVRRDLGLLVTTPAGDRDLPALADLPGTLARLGLPAGPATTLAWKPARRWVGRVGDVVLRVHRPGALPGLPPGLPGTVPELAGDVRRGVRALPFVPGRTLDDDPRPADLHAAGALLARLHAADVPGLAAADDGLAAAAHQVAVLLPDLADAAAALAERVADQGGTAVLHGDLSADQVVAGAGVALLDLDRVRRGAPADDLGSWRAAAVVVGRPGDDAALHAGYRTVAPLPPPDELRRHTAAHLLRRAAEPFRSARPDWEPQVRALLARALEEAP